MTAATVTASRAAPVLAGSVLLLCAVLAAVAASVPFWANGYLTFIVVQALIFIMLRQAWNVIAGIGGQLSLAFETVARYAVNLTGGDARLAVNYRGTAPGVMQFREPATFVWIDLAVVVAFFTCWPLRSRFGLRLQAARDDEHAAAASGVNVLGVRLAGLLVNTAMTAVAGALHVQFYLSIDPGTAFGLFQAIQIELRS